MITFLAFVCTDLKVQLKTQYQKLVLQSGQIVSMILLSKTCWTVLAVIYLTLITRGEEIRSVVTKAVHGISMEVSLQALKTRV